MVACGVRLHQHVSLGACDVRTSAFVWCALAGATDAQFEHAYQEQVMVDVRRSFHFRFCGAWSDEER